MALISLSSRKIFTDNLDTATIATGDTELLSRQMNEKSKSIDEKVLLLSCADDDTSTPTIQISVSLNIAGSWTTFVSIHSASVVPKEIKISSYGKSWWIKNTGVQFKITKSGAGAVTITKGNWS